MLCFIIVSSYRDHALKNLIQSIKRDNKLNLSSIFIVNDTPFKEDKIIELYDSIYKKYNINNDKILNFNAKGPNYGRYMMIEYIKTNFKKYTEFMLLDDDLEIPVGEKHWIDRFYTQYLLLKVDILSCIWNCDKEGKKRMHCSVLMVNNDDEVYRHNIQVNRLTLCHIPLASFISNFDVFSKIQFSKDIKFYGDFLDLGFQILENRITCICTPFLCLNHRYFLNRRPEMEITRFNYNQYMNILLGITIQKYKYRNLIITTDNIHSIIPKQFGFGSPKHLSDSWFVIERLIYDYLSMYYSNKIGFFNSFCEFNHLHNTNIINLPNNTFYISHLPINKTERFSKFNLQELINEPRFMENISKIKTILCLSPKSKEFFKIHYPDKNVILNRHPIIPFNKIIRFSIKKYEENVNKRLIFSGFFYRDEKPFLECEATNFKKIWYIGRDRKTLETKFPELDLNLIEEEIEIQYFEKNPNELMNRLEDSIFMVNLIDATANNTILDCIQSATPILVNKSEEIEYYLGKQYPMFYSSMDELNKKLNNKELIITTHEYLKNINIKPFSIKNIFNKIDLFYNNKHYPKNKKNIDSLQKIEKNELSKI